MEIRRYCSKQDRYARSTLLWCGVALCLSPLLGGWLVDHCPFYIRDPEAAASLSLWSRTQPHAEILVLGSSRLGSFVRTVDLAASTTKLLGNDSAHIVNAALTAGEPITINLLTRRLLAAGGAPPRLVVLETSPDLLARDNTYFSFVITRDLTAADLPAYLGDIIFSRAALARLLSSRVTPFYRHRNHLLTWAGETIRSSSAAELPGNSQPLMLEANSFQYVRDKEKDADALPLSERMRIGAHAFPSHLRHYQLGGATSAAFEDTVARLRARGCAIVLVEPPLSSVQRALLTTEMRKAFEIFLERLQASYDCTVADYSERLPDTLFVDNHHANNSGSSRFTELLATEVVAPAWRALGNKGPE